MTLQGWSLPLSPGGTASLVPPPPWHFSGEALGIDFLADPAAVAAVLPDGLEPLGDGSCSFVFCDWSAAADTDSRVVADPARGQYREAYLSVNATLDGRKVAQVPYIWVDNDLSFARGHIQGFPKKMGTVAITRAIRVGRGGPKLEGGGRFVGHASSLGQKLVQGSVTLEAPAAEGDVPRALRLPVWQGTAELELFGSAFEEHTALAPVEVSGGFRCSVAVTVTGAEARS